MKTDLNRLMQERGLDGLWVSGAAQHNPAMVYFTGIHLLTNADLLLRRGEAPVLFFYPMERDAAAATGLKTISYQRYPMFELLREAGGNQTKALALRAARMFADVGLTSGRVALYGQVEIGPILGTLAALREYLPGLEFVGEGEDSLLKQVRATKEEAELERIRAVGRSTLQVVDELLNYLSTRPVRSGILISEDGDLLRIGAVKRKIDLWLAERGLEAPEGTVFSIGRAAGVPHSSGDVSDPLELGKTIVLDIFPCEKGGGYFYDFTRTWCLGYATDEVQEIYEQVHQVYLEMCAQAQPGTPGKTLQDRACELFEGMGHATDRAVPGTENGYVHGLGHGVGLNIHEIPWITGTASERDIIEAGLSNHHRAWPVLPGARDWGTAGRYPRG